MTQPQETLEDTINLYSKGTRCWFPDERDGWIMGSLVGREQDSERVKMVFTLENGEEHRVEYKLTDIEAKRKELPFLHNPPVLEGVDDLTILSYLHEPAVLHTIKTRYKQQVIYTYSGIVLIALNPFAKLPIYTQDTMKLYSGKKRGELEPHLFAVAEEAYRNMITLGLNQSIIVSGESGAGKTQSAKYIMRYFAIVDDLEKKAMSRNNSSAGLPTSGSNESITQSMTEVEEAVLSTNPIMEAFGNAKTTRNDNSSRFGKYIEIQFSSGGPNKSVTIIGAKIRTYLLERSRLIYQPQTERNYHIFYQLCAAAPSAERKELALASWDHWWYLKQGACGTVDGMDDVEEFGLTQKALSSIGIQVSMQWNIFRVCAALLHIGNIQITGDDVADIPDTDVHLGHAARLLGLDVIEFKKWIVKKQLKTRFESILTDSNASQALVNRDSIAKYIYSALFEWIVNTINTNLAYSGPEEQRGTFIGVLDIYGFEHFQKNSFEQFCINYANEKLQQEFNQHVFKLEQDEYVQEEIQWSFIDFNDNGPCIEMIEGKLGILDLLDEESRMPSGSDTSLTQKLYNRLSDHKFFDKPRFGNESFTVNHYAVPVNYDVHGFLEKNRDTVNDEQLNVLLQSKFEFFSDLVGKISAESVEERAATVGGKKQVQKTLGGMFKQSLNALMTTINSTSVHYIRCIKPNMAKRAFQFDPPMVLSQLRACGVLETIRISCAGYPSRWTYSEFAGRYYLLVKSSEWKVSEKALTVKIVERHVKEADKFQMGKTKVFMRAGMLALFERLRSDRLNQAVSLIQRNMLRYALQKQFRLMRRSAIIIQKYVRGMLARRHATHLRQDKHARVIQKYARGFLARQKYQRTKQAIVRIQAAYRMYVAKKSFAELRYLHSAMLIQSMWRMYVVRRQYLRTRHLIILIQSCVRRRAAKKEYRLLRIKARDVNTYREKNFQLENKVVELSRTIMDKDNEIKMLQSRIADLESENQQLRTKASKVRDQQKEKRAEAETRRQFMKESKEVLEKVQKELEAANETVRNKDNVIAKLKEDLERQRNQIKVAMSKQRPTESPVMSMSPVPKEQLQIDTSSLKKSKRRQTDPPAVNLSALSREESQKEVALEKEVAMLRMENFKLKEQSPHVNQMEAALLQDDDWEIEVIDNLIAKLRIPLPSTQTILTRKEIFYPAHLIGMCMEKLLKHGMILRLSMLASSIVRVTQQLTSSFEDDYMSAFWLANCTELSSVLKYLLDREVSQRSRSHAGSPRSPVDSVQRAILGHNMGGFPHTPTASDKERALMKIRSDIDDLVADLYHGWIVELKKRVQTMIIPAVIENQSLPGYVCKQTGGLWNRLQGLGTGYTNPSYTIDQLLNFLSKLKKTLSCYYLEDGITRQIITELIKLIGIQSFNHLLMRRNFCTWKRGVQIQYNITRLEEWCKTQNTQEAALHLQPVLQAAKLLTLQKNTPQDVDTIFDVCYLLNTTQVKKLLALYTPDEYESPLSPEFLHVLSSRFHDQSNEPLLYEIDQRIEFTKPPTKAVSRCERFVPNWSVLPQLKALAEFD